MTPPPPPPSCAATTRDCVVLAEWYADEYPIHCGWQQCLDRVLPPVADRVTVDGQTYEGCLGFFVDDELGPHYLFMAPEGMSEVLLREVCFLEPLTEVAELWLTAYRDWRNGRTHRRRKPLRLVG